MSSLEPFAFSLALSLWASFILLQVGKNWLLDLPVGRKIHKQPVPRTGGFAIGIVYFLSLILFGFVEELWWYLVGAITLFVMGMADDHRSIRWPTKLFVELVVSSIVIFRFLGEVKAISFFTTVLNFSTLGLIAVFLIWFVGILNAVNLIDGMDGLAGGFMLLLTFIAIIMGIVGQNGPFVLVNTLLLGSIVGFLLYNRKPAKFFMGDSGSLLLGFHVACLPLLFHQFSSESALLEITPFLILSSFLIVDTTRVFFSRIFRGQNPMNADTIHLHHLVYKETNSYMGTLIPIFSVTLITGLGAIFFFIYGFGYLAMQLFLLVLIIFVLTPPVPFYVPLASRLTHAIAHLKTSRFSNKHLFRVRYLPVLGFIYLIILGVQAANSMSYSDLSVEFLAAAGLLLIFWTTGLEQDEATQAGIILFGMLQVLFFIQGDPLSHTTVLGTVRFICLSWMMIIAAANYVENSRHLGFEFWSAFDLLIFLLYAGLVILKLNGLSVSIFKWSEVVLMYYCLGLYALHHHPRAA